MTFAVKLHKNFLTELTLLIAASLVIVFGNINIYIIIISVSIHELGHIIAALIAGAKPENFSVHGFGIEISFPGKTPTTKKMLAISSSGPAASIFLAILGYQTNNLDLFIVNISIATINLIPVYPLDGGTILYSLLSPYFKRKSLYKILNVSGKIFGILIIFCGLLILFVSEFNFSLLYMGLFIFFSSNKLQNPVVEIFTTDYPKIEKSVLFSVDSSLSTLEVADNLPANAIAAIKDSDGNIISFVTPLYLYNQTLKKSRP